jgi:hypothetical protein
MQQRGSGNTQETMGGPLPRCGRWRGSGWGETGARWGKTPAGLCKGTRRWRRDGARVSGGRHTHTHDTPGHNDTTTTSAGPCATAARTFTPFRTTPVSCIMRTCKARRQAAGREGENVEGGKRRMREPLLEEAITHALCRACFILTPSSHLSPYAIPYPTHNTPFTPCHATLLPLPPPPPTLYPHNGRGQTPYPHHNMLPCPPPSPGNAPAPPKSFPRIPRTNPQSMKCLYVWIDVNEMTHPNSLEEVVERGFLMPRSESGLGMWRSSVVWCSVCSAPT